MFIKLKVLNRNGRDYEGHPIMRFNINKIVRYALLKNEVSIWICDSDASNKDNSIDVFKIEEKVEEVDALIAGAQERMAKLLYGST